MCPVQLLALGMSGGMGRGYPCAGPRHWGPPLPSRRAKPHTCGWLGQRGDPPEHQLPRWLQGWILPAEPGEPGAGQGNFSEPWGNAQGLEAPTQQGWLCPSAGGPGQPPKALCHGPVLGREWMQVGNSLSVKAGQRFPAALGTTHQHPILPA